MISAEFKDGRTPRVLGVYSYRFDEKLVPALRSNTEPFVDGWLSWDDRASTDVFSDELARRHALLTAAREAGAEWVLALDPDERIERRALRQFGTIIGSGSNVVSFAIREMYTARRFRVDGVWGKKRQVKLLKVSAGIVRPDLEPGTLHVPWTVFLATPRMYDASFNVYHLKMINSERRRARAALYSRLDPQRQMQSIGYDYLADDEGLQLRSIPLGRGYRPRHVDDGELWMARLSPETDR